MKKAAQKLLLTAFFAIAFLLLPKSAFASTIYLSPASGNIGAGQTMAVQVHLNTSGEAVNAVTAFLTFPSDKLDVSYVTAGSAFSIEAEKSIAAGAVKISRGSLSNVTGDVVIATVGFRGKALGSATVTVAPGSAAANAVNSGDTINLGSSKGGNYTIIPAPASTPGQATTKISDLQVIDITNNGATVIWKTDKKADSTVEYGVDQNSLALSTSTPTKVTDHSVKLENLSFPPGTKVFLRVKSKDATNQEAISEVTSFQTKGYKVIVTVIGSDGKPLSDVKMTIYSDPLVSATNDSGQVTYENVTPGKHVLLLQNGTLEKSQEIEVADNGDLDTAQAFTVQFDPATSTTPRTAFPLNSKNNIALIILIISLLTLILVAIYLIMKRRRNNDSGGPGTGVASSNPFPVSGNEQTSNPNPVVFHPGS